MKLAVFLFALLVSSPEVLGFSMYCQNKKKKGIFSPLLSFLQKDDYERGKKGLL